MTPEIQEAVFFAGMMLATGVVGAVLAGLLGVGGGIVIVPVLESFLVFMASIRPSACGCDISCDDQPDLDIIGAGASPEERRRHRARTAPGGSDLYRRHLRYGSWAGEIRVFRWRAQAM